MSETVYDNSAFSSTIEYRPAVAEPERPQKALDWMPLQLVKQTTAAVATAVVVCTAAYTDNASFLDLHIRRQGPRATSTVYYSPAPTFVPTVTPHMKARAQIVTHAFSRVPLSAAERGDDPDYGF